MNTRERKIRKQGERHSVEKGKESCCCCFLIISDFFFPQSTGISDQMSLLTDHKYH